MRASVQTLKRARKLRRKMTLPEILLWQRLRGRKLNGLAFRHQHPEDPYILDFYCTAARLAVEVDGISHESRGEHDIRRDAFLAKRGIRVLRIPAIDILRDDNIEDVLATIALAAAPSTAFGDPPPPLRGGGS
jgi:very-short-patch-repair endonuclease